LNLSLASIVPIPANAPEGDGGEPDDGARFADF